jgi:predicted nucleic acid-binding protein
VIVVDASVAVAALTGSGTARGVLSSEQLHAPHLIDVEIAHALRRLVVSGRVDAATAWSLLDRWRRLAVTRYPAAGLLERVWELRANLSSYDACYVALAEALDCALLTADGRLGRAPGLRCAVTVVPG